MSDLPEFVGFPKISRLNREICITEKIDGTNARIYISDDLLTMWAGSKNRWLSTASKADDNYGFAKWVEQNREELLKLGPGTHYGEWWGVGIGRGYDLSERRFSLFNTTRWGDAAARPACVGVVPVLYEGPWVVDPIRGKFAPDMQLERLRAAGSMAVPRYMKPEGIVVFHKASQVMFKATCEKDEQWKGVKENS